MSSKNIWLFLSYLHKKKLQLIFLLMKKMKIPHCQVWIKISRDLFWKIHEFELSSKIYIKLKKN